MIELLVVMAIITVLLVALIPAVNSLSKSTGRKGAVGNLMSLLEQARALAITEGRNTYVAFATNLPASVPASVSQEYSFKASAVFAEPAGGGTKVQITKWQKLPIGLSFRKEDEPPEASGTVAGTCITSTSNTTTLPFSFQPGNATITCPYIRFDPTGTVIEPTSPSPMRVVIFEGAVTADAEAATGRDSAGLPIRAEIQIAKFTGRTKSVMR